MARYVDVALLPGEMEFIQAEGTLAVIIDVLRASTTMVTALANGAAQVIPLKDIEKARARHAQEPGFLLGGERNANPPPGFDLGNSPREYTKEKVGGRGVIMTTTNGTAALEAAHKGGATTIIVGALTNRQAVVDFCQDHSEPILLVCAGCQGRFSLEDALCAGAIIAGLGSGLKRSDTAETCLALYETWGPQGLAKQIFGSVHGQRLERIGYGEDIEWATRLDVSSLVPIYRDGEIRVFQGPRA
ncbi:MAG: 2-phosphosulfolactate phosphatase [Firmicutes bacterium]|nr:2-phosphosulfolactate phosphatase [Bacillota bacterium]